MATPDRARPAGRPLTGVPALLSTLAAMVGKEFTVWLRYPVEFIASFVQVFVVVSVLTLSELMFSQGGGADQSAKFITAGLLVYGFILWMYLYDTLFTIGYNVRREQRQGTLDQIYLSPASKFAHLIARAVVTLVWTGLLSLTSVVLMSLLLGGLPFENLPLAAFILVMALSGTFGVGFAFAAMALRIGDTTQTLANFLQFSSMIVCAPFFPFSSLPPFVQAISRTMPLAYAIDAFRSTLMGYPAGFPELAPIEVELVVVSAFGLLMPLLGYWLYRRAEQRARRLGSLSAW